MADSEVTNKPIEGQIFEPQIMALQGIRIVDLTVIGAGPVGTRLLGELGAEVIKIEQPVQGDPFRHAFKRNPVPGVPPNAPENPVWEDISRNKLSVTLDLHKEKAREILHQLVTKADVFTANLLPGALKRFGADYETLSKINPKLVYVRGSIFGPKGPDADRPGGAPSGAAKSGFMTLHNNYETAREPLLPSIGTCDEAHALGLAYAVLAGLMARGRLGIGQEITLSQLSASINLLISYSTAQEYMWGMHQFQYPHDQNPRPLSGWYKCKDGKWMLLAIYGETPEQWKEFCIALGKPELIDDPRFKENQAQHSAELIKILDEAFITKTQAEWDAALRKTGVDRFCAVNELSDLASDPQVVANNYIWEVDHPVYGRIKYPGHPVTFSKTPATFRTPAPELGQHTEVVLMDLLGYSWDEVAKLKEEAVI